MKFEGSSNLRCHANSRGENTTMSYPVFLMLQLLSRDFERVQLENLLIPERVV